jgi:hypothetical protein
MDDSLSKDDIEHLIKLLDTDGFFIDSDISISLSVTGNVTRLGEILTEAGWSGSLQGSATYHGGHWPYWCYDIDSLDPDHAQTLALAEWDRRNSNKGASQ